MKCNWHKDGTLPSESTHKYNCPIFVFGSNICGSHSGGAALVAKEKFGARDGCGLGEQGESYAIATLDEYMEKASIELIAQQVDCLFNIICRSDYYVDCGVFITRVGCGIAGFKDNEIAPMFKKFTQLEYVDLPETWRPYFKQ